MSAQDGRRIRAYLARTLRIDKKNVDKAVRYLIDEGLMQVGVNEEKKCERATIADIWLSAHAARIQYRCEILAAHPATAGVVAERGWEAVCSGVDEVLGEATPKDAMKSLQRAVEAYLADRMIEKRSGPVILKDEWMRVMEPVRVAKGCGIKVSREQFGKGVSQIRKEILDGAETLNAQADENHQRATDRASVDAVIVTAFEEFAGSCYGPTHKLYLHPAWSIFMTKRSKYVHGTSIPGDWFY